MPADADAVADRWPELRFSRRHRELIGTRPRQPTDRLFDDLYGGADVAVHTVSGRAGGATLEVDLARWSRPADDVDQMVVARVRAARARHRLRPGSDGRCPAAFGRAALGIDISAVAVARRARRAGGQVLRRDLALPLAAEGRWGTALLLDGNIGIGGDVRRVAAALSSDRGRRRLDHLRDRHRPGAGRDVRGGAESPGCRSAPVPWAAIGIRRLTGVAAALDLIVTEVWEADRRSFVALRTAS